MVEQVERKPFTKRYALRKPYKEAKFALVGIPWLVIEREAAQRGITPDEFIERFEGECQFDNFEGLKYQFVPKE
jgi:hypothetical protein